MASRHPQSIPLECKHYRQFIDKNNISTVGGKVGVNTCSFKNRDGDMQDAGRDIAMWLHMEGMRVRGGQFPIGDGNESTQIYV